MLIFQITSEKHHRRISIEILRFASECGESEGASLMLETTWSLPPPPTSFTSIEFASVPVSRLRFWYLDRLVSDWQMWTVERNVKIPFGPTEGEIVSIIATNETLSTNGSPQFVRIGNVSLESISFFVRMDFDGSVRLWFAGWICLSGFSRN